MYVGRLSTQATSQYDTPLLNPSLVIISMRGYSRRPTYLSSLFVFFLTVSFYSMRYYCILPATCYLLPALYPLLSSDPDVPHDPLPFTRTVVAYKRHAACRIRHAKLPLRLFRPCSPEDTPEDTTVSSLPDQSSRCVLL